MNWHYQLGKMTDAGGVYYHVIEVYCDEDRQPWAWTFAKPSYADSADEAKSTLQMMVDDCEKHHVLDLDKPMPGKGPEADDDL